MNELEQTIGKMEKSVKQKQECQSRLVDSVMTALDNYFSAVKKLEKDKDLPPFERKYTVKTDYPSKAPAKLYLYSKNNYRGMHLSIAVSDDGDRNFPNYDAHGVQIDTNASGLFGLSTMLKAVYENKSYWEGTGYGSRRMVKECLGRLVKDISEKPELTKSDETTLKCLSTLDNLLQTNIKMKLEEDTEASCKAVDNIKYARQSV